MNPSTASNRLVKDILFSFIEKESPDCFQCGSKLTRETFSVEHKKPWLDSDTPKELFFDLENISFSHLKCNIRAARRDKKPCGSATSYARGCRCAACTEARRIQARSLYCKEKRRSKYKRTGY